MAFHHETKRLVLHSWRDGDVEAFEAACNTAAVTRFLGGLQTRDELEAAVARIRSSEVDNGFCFWALERREDGAFLGFCGLKPMHAENSPPQLVGMPEIGWRLRESAWGQGYAREAAEAALALGFGPFGFDQIYAITMEANAASWGLMRRLGMSARPDLDFDMPRYGRHVTYRIGREQWTE